MSTRTVKTNGVEIVTGTFGDPARPPVLLIMGAMASMLWWPDAFCERLAAEGRHVIRYDNRDTGLSTIYEPGKPDYSKDDMARDAIGVLDAYGLDKADIVGMSLGGMIAQIAALDHPARVRSLTLISTTPMGIDTSDLPQTSEAYMEHGARGAEVDWSDRTQTIDYVVADMRMIAGTAHPHDAVQARAFVERDYDRARNFQSVTNHFMLGGGDDHDIRNLSTPLLVIHGSADPIFPIEHGEAIAAAVADARLLRLEGGGHELHPGDWDRIIGAIISHTANDKH